MKKTDKKKYYELAPGIDLLHSIKEGYALAGVERDPYLAWCVGNALKYLIRAGRKDPAKVGEDLRKAAYYAELASEYAQNESD